MIIFVRHGQTAVNRQRRLQGRVDVPLTDVGRDQASRVAVALAPAGVAGVYASPLGRARETAAVIAARAGVEVEVDERLVELDYGDWDRRPLPEIAPSEWQRWRDDVTYAPPGGESLLVVAQRVVEFCTDRLGAAPIVAVSHVSPIKAAVAWALGAGPELTWRMHLDLASITRVGVADANRVFLASFNETGHLA